MERTIEILIKLINIEIFGSECCLTDFSDISSEEWKNILYLAKKHDVVHIIGNCILKHKLVSDEQIKAFSEKQTISAVLRHEKAAYELERLKAVFESEKIPFLPLKGAVVRKYYPEEWLRNSCDIDILVKECDLQKAESAVIKSLNYKSEAKCFHNISMYSENGIHFELHYSIMEVLDIIDVVLKDVWDYAEKKSEDSYEYILTPEYLLFHLYAHSLHHFVKGGCGIKPLADIFLLKRKMLYDDKKLCELIKKASIEKYAKAIDELSEVWFGDGKYTDDLIRFEKYIMLGGSYGNSKNKANLSQADKGKAKSIIRRIWMPYSELTDCFDNKNLKKILIPYYQAARWIKTIKNGRIGLGIKEIKTQMSADKSEVNETKKMLEKLDLKF